MSAQHRIKEINSRPLSCGAALVWHRVYTNYVTCPRSPCYRVGQILVAIAIQ